MIQAFKVDSLVINLFVNRLDCQWSFWSNLRNFYPFHDFNCSLLLFLVIFFFSRREGNAHNIFPQYRTGKHISIFVLHFKDH